MTNVDNNITNDVHIVTSKVQDNETEFAKEKELKKLHQFDTYREVKNDGQPTLATRWVITKKDGKAKARLVVRGFEEDFIMPRDSPTVGKGAMRTILAIAASMKWVIKSKKVQILKSRKKNPQNLTQLSSRSHPRNLVGKRTAQKDITTDTKRTAR